MRKKIKCGFYWHVHDDKLIEWCYDEDTRVIAIIRDKPANKIPACLRAFQPVKGKLPIAVFKAGVARRKADAAMRKADTTLQKANIAWWKAGAAWRKAEAAWRKAKAAWRKAKAAWLKAETAWWKAGAELQDVLKANMPAIKALHKKECPDCGWDGKTIKF